MHKFIHSAAELAAYIDEIGFLPLLNVGVPGWSVDAVADDEAQYTRLPEGGWEWPLWKWKGQVVQSTGCAYGQFFMGKTGFVSRRWWPEFCCWRRSLRPAPSADSVEAMVLATLSECGSMITRELRTACGFTGPKMRGKFDGYVGHLQRDCRVVTEDFIYPQDHHGRDYGWGWSLLTTPERLFGPGNNGEDLDPAEAFDRMAGHFDHILPGYDARVIIS